MPNRFLHGQKSSQAIPLLLRFKAGITLMMRTRLISNVNARAMPPSKKASPIILTYAIDRSSAPCDTTTDVNRHLEMDTQHRYAAGAAPHAQAYSTISDTARGRDHKSHRTRTCTERETSPQWHAHQGLHTMTRHTGVRMQQYHERHHTFSKRKGRATRVHLRGWIAHQWKLLFHRC